MQKEIPQLSNVEQRVLGSLIEKSRTTPDYYPMTLNSITLACNQKSSRNPIVQFSEDEVQKALNSLKGISLVSTAIGGGSRTIKYKHNLTTVFPMHDGQLAALCVLLLRGPQTAGEINTNSGRIYDFGSLNAVIETIDSLMQNDNLFVQELPRKAGQKERRFIHLFGHTPDQQDSIPAQNNSNETQSMEEKINHLENEILNLKTRIELLEQQIK